MITFYSLSFLILLVCQVLVLCDIRSVISANFDNRKVALQNYITQNNLSLPEQCARPCDGSKRRCYYNFYLEQYATQTRACHYCFPNGTNNCQCIIADGVDRSVTVANRRLPGPSIEVCEGDEVVIDVENHLEGSDVTIHWHGLYHHGTQYYDGVPFVTQCPILQGNTFRYTWTATHPGTHYWHSHTGFQKMDGLTGSIIIRQPLAVDPHSKLYDFDLSEHVMFVQDWIHELAGNRYPGCMKPDETHLKSTCHAVSQIPDNILINGKGVYEGFKAKNNIAALEVFKVFTGRRYRFRLIGAISLACPIQVRVKNHALTVIASDGEPLQPVQVDRIILTSGERYDFIIHTDNEPGHYDIEVQAVGLCTDLGISQVAKLEYIDECLTNSVTSNWLPIGKVYHSLDSNCDETQENAICVSELHSAKQIDEGILKVEPDVKLFLPFSLYTYEDEELFNRNEFNNFFVPLGGDHMAGLMNNISYVPPPSPLLSQFAELNPNQFCTNLKMDCQGMCRCTHLLKLPLNGVIELILIDQLKQPHLVHPFHLHGHTFYILGSGRISNVNESISLEKVMLMDDNNQLYSGNDHPPSKDTVSVPNNGYVVIRFRANSPGFWLFHCHFLNHLLTGMSIVLQIGDPSDFPPVPKNFPRCGDFIPEI
ncbi:hypothetical protein PPYR_00197 [Photinus pyralis]|uniref:Uncharacterized protein n=2 Tax=Photinus pyralis TaxID=7054 RepID=A0A5N4B0V7_PHOPY|nr:laccase-5-like [Photinus pyralis]KAB0803227.1 hypothetical protein PPYR_00197 [Photinus pyralis]